MRVSRAEVFFFVLLVAVSASVATTSAQDADYPRVHYALLDASTYQEGCFDPCDCYLLEEQPMRGSFDLVFYPYAGPLWRVAVEQVSWSVPSLGLSITGSGNYVRAGSMQQMTLDLSINGDPARSFDSGWVEGGDSYPAIDVALSLNQMFCYDVVLRLAAAPLSETPTVVADGDGELSWSEIPGGAGYDVVRGDLATLRESADYAAATDACLADGLVQTTLSYSLDVEPGQAAWFLVREQGGSYDSDMAHEPASRDPGIDAAAGACP